MKPLIFRSIRGFFAFFLLFPALVLPAQTTDFKPGDSCLDYENQKAEWIKNHPDEYQKLNAQPVAETGIEPTAVAGKNICPPARRIDGQEILKRNLPESLLGTWNILSTVSMQTVGEGDKQKTLVESIAPVISSITLEANERFHLSGDGKELKGSVLPLGSYLNLKYDNLECKACGNSIQIQYKLVNADHMVLTLESNDENGKTTFVMEFEKTK